jgi:hypothetical protein
LSFGDKQLLVVAIAHGGDSEWGDHTLDVAMTWGSTTSGNVGVSAERRISERPPFSKFMAGPISRRAGIVRRHNPSRSL